MADDNNFSAALHDLLKLHTSEERREKQAQARRERASAKKKGRAGSGRGRGGAKRSAWEAGIGFGGAAGGSNKRAKAAIQKAGEQAAQEEPGPEFPPEWGLGRMQCLQCLRGRPRLHRHY